MTQISPSALRIAIQKSGRLNDNSMELLKQMGLQFENYDRKLFSSCKNFDLDILFVRDKDIPEYVEDGVADFGILGLNTVKEQKHKVKIVKKLGFGFCALELAVPKGSKIRNIKQLQNTKIATSYPNALKVFFKQNSIKAEIVEIRGSVEITPTLGVADAICDLVSTGSTLRTNNLESIGTLFESEAVLVANNNILKDTKKQKNIERLLLRLDACLLGRNKKYIMMNAPESALNKIQKILPGIDSPTIMPLAQEGMIAIHSVISAEDQFWDMIEDLKTVGATAILVTPIEKIIV
jgi:ATP phosphoribosyltransferase